jgi:hypothetical protein
MVLRRPYDSCPYTPNIGDSDGDGIDDACDESIDADRRVCDDVDSCPQVPNAARTVTTMG